MGPLINKAGRDKMAAMVDARSAAGRAGIDRRAVADRPGYHYEPTVLVGCSPEWTS